MFVTHFLTMMESTRIWTTTTDVLFFNAVIKIATVFGLRKWMFFQSSGSTSGYEKGSCGLVAVGRIGLGRGWRFQNTGDGGYIGVLGGRGLQGCSFFCREMF